MASILITGATGFVGSHVVEAGVQRGLQVRVLVRPGSDAATLCESDVEVIRGDLTEQQTLREAVAGVDAVVHCAAKLGDWGPVDGYRAVNVEGLRNLLEVCRGQASLRHFIHLSSLGVYAARNHHGTDETEPLSEQHIDGYTQTKVEGEHVALDYYRDHGVPVTILRPGFIYGPRDRTVLPRLIEKLKLRRLRYLGGSTRLMNTIYIGNLVDGIFAALDKPAAVGQIYNLTDGEKVSKRRLVEAIADGMDLPRPSGFPFPLWLASWIVGLVEKRQRRRLAPNPPRLTQAMIKFLGLNLDFSIDKARRELGYMPRVSFDEAMRLTTTWFREQAAVTPERSLAQAPMASLRS